MDAGYNSTLLPSGNSYYDVNELVYDIASDIIIVDSFISLINSIN
jgi:hypothetical protein